MPSMLLLGGDSGLGCECLGTYRGKLLGRATDEEQDKSGQGDSHRTAQGGGRGLMQGVKGAGGFVLPAGKAAEEQVSPTQAVTHPACPGL